MSTAAGVTADLRALGAQIANAGDDLLITGPTSLRGAVVDPQGDHRLALTFAVAGLLATGDTTILGADCVAVSYPGFFLYYTRSRPRRFDRNGALRQDGRP